MAENLTRRRLRRDLEKLVQDHPSLQDPERLSRLKQDLTAREGKKMGRPSKGVNQFKQVNVYMPPDMVAELDRRVDQEIQRTGRNVSRADVIREAVMRYLHTQEKKP